jgi:hypothetical protein
MSPKTQRYILGALLVILAITTLVNWRSSPELQIALGSDRGSGRLIVENPSLKLDLLKKIQAQEYTGTHRNIFNASLPPPPAPEPDKTADDSVKPIGPTLPPAPPELVVPFKFYGFSASAVNGRKRGFFTNGDDIWIVSEGENIQSRFRIVRISPTTAEVEEIASGRRKTLPLEESAAPQG